MSDEIKTTAEAHEATALPCARVVHSDPNAPITAEQVPLPKSMQGGNAAESKSPAQWAYERLILYIKNFEEQLDNEHEVAMGFAGGEAGVLLIEGLGYFAPDLVTFYGQDDAGTRTQLIQHVTQLSVILQAVPRAEVEEEPRRIGFRLAAGLEEE